MTDPARPRDPWWRDRTARRSLPRELAVALRAGRVRRGWSARRTARELHVSQPMISYLERGMRVPSVAMAETLIAGLRLSPGAAAGLRAVARPHAGRSSPFRTRVPPVRGGG